jgi:glutamine amidotransferase/cyclase
MNLLKGFIGSESAASSLQLSGYHSLPKTVLSKRVIACLDVRTNDDGDLVVTKGDQYDVREASDSSQGRCLH